MKKLIFLFLLYFISYNVTAQESNNGEPIGLNVGKYDTIWCSQNFDTLLTFNYNTINYFSRRNKFNYSIYSRVDNKYKEFLNFNLEEPFKFFPNSTLNFDTIDGIDKELNLKIEFKNELVNENKIDKYHFTVEKLKSKKIARTLRKNFETTFEVKFYFDKKIIHIDTLTQLTNKEKINKNPDLSLFRKNNLEILMIELFNEHLKDEELIKQNYEITILFIER
jgi:hypothetical protein